MFPSHIGSRSTEASHKTALEILVSIPHWFSLNGEDCWAGIYYLPFPSHIGSRSTQKDDVFRLFMAEFPSHIGSRSEEPSIVHRPRAWTRPWREREEERKRESKRKERAKMGTDRLLWSVPDFRITNNQQRTTNNLSYHPTLVLAQRGQSPLPDRPSFCFHPTISTYALRVNEARKKEMDRRIGSGRASN